ncbi:MAG: LytTR family transcriptional regulator DNA-binding domain-containing protein [Bacteroidales bacterium]|nr:LytTR family transcriptional regulator DNA-binding domain-containing protein [Bacteroidales bacterium]
MDTTLRVSKGYGNQVKYAFILPVFFFFFIFVYSPFSFKDYLDVGGKSWTFHLLMLSLIMAGVLALTRLVFSVLYKYVAFKWWHYVVWCFGEALVSSFFFALYISLFYIRSGGMPYFTALSYSFKIIVLTLVYPYVISIAGRVIRNKSADLEDVAKEPEDTLIKFYDEHKRLKLTIDPAAVLFIAADENYIKINYLENDRVKVYQLRNSMKSFEADAARHGFVRCHRSYYVNPRHVRLLSRGKDGIIYTEFIREGVGRIPVSKQYYQKLADML